MLPRIRDALIALDPEQAARYRANCEALAAEVSALAARVAALFAQLPADKRAFLSMHAAWKQYADDFGLRELLVELDGKEPGPRSLARLIKTARENGLNTLVADGATHKATADALRENMPGMRLLHVNTMEEQWPDMLWRFSVALSASLAR
jgi:zinc transport system substrate-binding protein